MFMKKGKNKTDINTKDSIKSNGSQAVDVTGMIQLEKGKPHWILRLIGLFGWLFFIVFATVMFYAFLPTAVIYLATYMGFSTNTEVLPSLMDYVILALTGMSLVLLLTVSFLKVVVGPIYNIIQKTFLSLVYTVKHKFQIKKALKSKIK